LINNLLRIFSYKDKLIFFFFILAFVLLSILDILGIYFLSIGISGIFDQNNIFSFLKNFEKIKINLLTNLEIKYFYLFILIFFLFKNFLAYFFYYFQAYFISDLSSSISSKLFYNFFRSDYLKFVNFNRAENIKNLTNDVSKSIQLINIVNVFAKETVLLLLIIIIIFFFNKNFFFLITGLIILLLLIFKILYSNKLKKFANENQHYLSNQIKRILNSFNLYIDIKLYNLINFFYLKYKNESYKKELSEQKANSIINVPRLIIEVFIVFLLYLFILIVTTKVDLINEISLLIIFSLRTIPSIISINRAFFDLKFCIPSLNILLKIFNKKDSVGKINKKNLDADFIFNFKKEIIFQNVSFGYEKNKNIINNLNLKIKKNEKIVIYGKSGEGKTTLLLILLGFIKPTKGKIIVDGLNLNKLSNIWGEIISFAPQDTVLINDTLIENIAFKKNLSKSDLQRLKDSLKISKSGEFLNKKYKNINIEEQGLNFSGGQRKRIGLARALYKKADIYIFDEPTSFLDDKTSEDILRNLKLFLLNKTAIFVTHNKKLLSFCKKKYYLKNGNLYSK
jgi:ABC-type multidrug transport system fused ATPase/permease subunit